MGTRLFILGLVIGIFITNSFYSPIVEEALRKESKTKEKYKKTLQENISLLKENIILSDTISEKFTEENMLNFMEEMNIKFPHIVIAQCFLETGFNSNLFKNHNNLFGMTLAGQRPIMSNKTTKSGFVSYKHWKESVIDYALWQAQNFTGKTEKDYYSLLARVYNKKPGYVNKIKQVSRHFKKKT